VAGASNGGEPSLSDVLAAVNAVASSMTELQRRVEQVEGGGMRTVPMEPEPKGDARAVNPEALDPFTRKLWEQKTHDVPENYGGDREPAYNVPLRRYLKPDGTYAMLQADAKNRAYYTDKGCHMLSDDENADYAKVEPLIVQEQREKAHLITVIRRLRDTDPSLVGHRDDFELNLMSTDELRHKWKEFCAQTSQPDRPLPPMKRFRSEGRDKMLDGVETQANMSKEDLDAKLGRAQRSGRVIEVTRANWQQFAT
jgi:hypothetical protein